jgi:hypothetical protein
MEVFMSASPIRSSDQLQKLGLLDTTPRRIKNNEKVDVICLCGNKGIVSLNSILLTFKKNNRGWSCKACQNKMSAEAQKGKRTGKDNPFFGKRHTDETKKKISDNNIKMWENPTMVDKEALVDRLKAGRIDRFGTDKIMDILEIKERAIESNKASWKENHDARLQRTKDSNIRIFGCSWATQSSEVQDRVIATNLERYGVKRPAQSPEIKAKISQIFFDKYAGNPMLCQEIKEKHIKSLLNRDKSSVAEIEVRDFIKSLGYEVVKTYIGGNEPKEIDIHAVGTKFFLEFNIAFYHSSYFPKITSSYHKKKREQCLSQYGAHLIQIFDYEWETKKQQVKGFLESKLSKTFEKIRASDCEVRQIDKTMANIFLDAIHLQGGSKLAFMCLGLFKGDRLLSVMQFSKPHRQNMDARPHMSRFATLNGVRVYGGLSKMSKYAFNLSGEFISYVHCRLSNGDSYRKAGYELELVVNPDYVYFDVKSGDIVSKQSRKKQTIITPDGMTEKQFAASQGLYQVHDCGKLRFKFSI